MNCSFMGWHFDIDNRRKSSAQTYAFMRRYYSPLKGTDWTILFKKCNRRYFEKRESNSGWKVWQISIPLQMLISSLYNIGWLKINDTRMGEVCVHKNNRTGNARYVRRNNEGRSRNHCFDGKTIGITYSEYVFAALISTRSACAVLYCRLWPVYIYIYIYYLHKCTLHTILCRW